jgi:hypothetical protein
MDDNKHTCPTCNVVFETPPGGPALCPLCNTTLPAAPRRGAAPAAPRRTPGGAVATVVLAVLGGSLILAMPHLVHFDPPPAAAPASTPPAAAEEPTPEGDLPLVVNPSPLVLDTSLLVPPKPPPQLPDAVPPPAFTGPTQAEINRAIERGVAFLKQHMDEVRLPCRYEGLLGLALLECGVPADDPVVQRIAASLRKQVATMTGTYEMSLAILFFDRLEGSADSARIRSLAEALAAGQTTDGGWSYHCPRVTATGGTRQPPQGFPTGRPASPARNGLRPLVLSVRPDHSNTQFAVLGLWVAQRHGRSTYQPLDRVDRHFRGIQNSDGGWGYLANMGSSLANTCSGLLALAAGHGINSQAGRDARPLDGPRAGKDPAVAAALGRIARMPMPGLRRQGGQVQLVGTQQCPELYTLWSVERVATLYDLKEIGGLEWYPAFALVLVRTQQDGGSWNSGRGEPIDTSFALLILRRSNLLPDLTATLQGKDPTLQHLPAARPARTPPAGPSGSVTQKPPDPSLSGTAAQKPPAPSAATTPAPARSGTVGQASAEAATPPARAAQEKKDPEQR